MIVLSSAMLIFMKKKTIFFREKFSFSTYLKIEPGFTEEFIKSGHVCLRHIDNHLWTKRETHKTRVIPKNNYLLIFILFSWKKFAINNYFSWKLKDLCYAEVGTFVIISPYIDLSLSEIFLIFSWKLGNCSRKVTSYLMPP